MNKTLDSSHPVTVRQEEILGIIADLMCQHGGPPTLRELCEATGIHSPNGVMFHIDSLEKKGYVEYGVTRILGATARKMRLTAKATELLGGVVHVYDGGACFLRPGPFSPKEAEEICRELREFILMAATK